MVSEPEEAEPQRDHPNVRPINCDGDHRIAAREVEGMLRHVFKFPESLDEQVTLASEMIAARMLYHAHQVNMLYWNPTSGTA